MPRESGKRAGVELPLLPPRKSARTAARVRAEDDSTVAATSGGGGGGSVVAAQVASHGEELVGKWVDIEYAARASSSEDDSSQDDFATCHRPRSVWHRGALQPMRPPHDCIS